MNTKCMRIKTFTIKKNKKTKIDYRLSKKKPLLRYFLLSPNKTPVTPELRSHGDPAASLNNVISPIP